MDVIEAIFPTPLMRVKGFADADLLRALTDRIRKAPGATRQNAKSAQLSHSEIINPAGNPDYQRLIQLAGPKLVDFGALLFGQRMRWFIKELWTNVLEAGGQQSLHSHANSFISGVCYLTRSHPSASTVFSRASGGSGEFVFRHDSADTAVGPFNAGKWVTPEIEAGDLILFPSHLLHEVPRNQGGQRITLAFNAVPERLESHGYAIHFTPR